MPNYNINKLVEKWYLPLCLLFVAGLKWSGAWLAFSQGKWLAVHFTALLVCGLALIRGPLLPRLKLWEAVALGLVYTGMLAQLFYHSPAGFEFTLVDRWSFLFVMIGAWGSFQKGILRWDDFWWPLATLVGVVSLIGLYQMWKVGFPGEMPYLVVGSTFGHANNTAQALGLALLLWWSLNRPRLKAALWVQPIVSGIALTYFFFLRGRSTLMGLALALLLLAVLRFRKEGQVFFRRPGIFAAGVLVLVLFGGLQLAKGKSVSDLVHLRILSEKSSMVLWRSDVWTQTVKMIQANPWGVGPDRFTFAFVPFHAAGNTFTENGVADTPHNEVLRYLAEDGMLLAPLYLLVILYLFIRWLQKKQDWQIILPALLFLSVETVTQFPFNNPFPSFLFALMLGYMGSLVWEKNLRLKNKNLVRGVVAAVLLVQVLFCTKVAIARSFEHGPNYELSSLSCRMVPLNWHSCLTKARDELEAGKLQQARETAEEIFFDDPWNFTAMRYLSLVAFRQGDPLEACFFLYRYDHLYKDHSSIHANLIANCRPKWLNYFQRKQPHFYSPRYQAYMQRHEQKQAGFFSSLRFWE
jgi:hypothetical protein